MTARWPPYKDSSLFAREIVASRPPEALALVELGRDGVRREWSFAAVDQRSGALAGSLVAAGVGRGDVVMTLVGNRPDFAGCTP